MRIILTRCFLQQKQQAQTEEIEIFAPPPPPPRKEEPETAKEVEEEKKEPLSNGDVSLKVEDLMPHPPPPLAKEPVEEMPPPAPVIEEVNDQEEAMETSAIDEDQFQPADKGQ